MDGSNGTTGHGDDAAGSESGAGAESPEEGNAAMEQAEEATVDDGDSDG